MVLSTGGSGCTPFRKMASEGPGPGRRICGFSTINFPAELMRESRRKKEEVETFTTGFSKGTEEK